MTKLDDITRRSKPCWTGPFNTWSPTGTLTEDDVKWLIEVAELAQEVADDEMCYCQEGQYCEIDALRKKLEEESL